MDVPNLDNLIKALECKEWRSSICKQCPYGFLDDHGDTPILACNGEKIKEESLFYLKLYQHLINWK